MYGYNFVAPSIELRVFYLKFWVCKDMLDTVAYTLVEASGSLEAGDSPLQLRAVEANGNGFVTKEVAFEIPFFGCNSGKEVGGDIVGTDGDVERTTTPTGTN